MFKAVVRFVLRLLFRVRVRGSPPAHTPDRLLIIANHQSLIDPFLLGAFLPYRPTWVVHQQIWARWYFRVIIRWTRYVVVDTSRPQAVKTLVREIEKGRPVVVFPEGRITVTGGLMKIYDGPAFLAAKTGAAILPVSIDGAIHTWFSRMKPPFPRKPFPRITLSVMPLHYIPMPPGRTGKIRHRLARQKMHRLMEEMRYASRVRRSLPEAFLEAMAIYGRRAPILDDVQREGQTYGHLLKASLALGRLVSRLAAEGDVVGVLLPNTGVTAALLLGMFATRRIPAMLNYSAGVDGMQTACAAARIRTVLTSRAFLEKARLADRVAQLSGVELVLLEDLRPRFTLIDKLWLVCRALRFPRSVIRRSAPGDPAIVLFTSGSEGKPKGVLLSHDSVLANVAQIKAVIEFSNRDKFLNALPMFHSFGLTAGVLIPLLTGCRVFLYPSPLHFRIIPELVYDRDCTILLGTPAFLARYGAVAHPYDFYKIHYVIGGAEKLSEEVRRLWMDKFGVRILEAYGVTECSPGLCINTPVACQTGSVGKLLPGIESRIVRVPGVERGGCLHVKGANLMLGYYRHTSPGVLEPPSSSVGAGWYGTGDVVEIDDTGFVHITARLKRFAKVAGEMVSLEVVENIAGAASPHHRSAASTKARSDRGEILVLFTQDPELRRGHLAAAARRLGLPELAVARRVKYVEKLPMLASGKVDYVKLKAMAETLP